uniref:Reverse transcriptase domain-containing protein n=1 Tax=Steinernema glaseri TaxID=37863 RepID=A0A1I7YLW5_9BILA
MDRKAAPGQSAIRKYGIKFDADGNVLPRLVAESVLRTLRDNVVQLEKAVEAHKRQAAHEIRRRSTGDFYPEQLGYICNSAWPTPTAVCILLSLFLCKYPALAGNLVRVRILTHFGTYTPRVARIGGGQFLTSLTAVVLWEGESRILAMLSG